jgi:Domain of unknown function (DUF4399)
MRFLTVAVFALLSGATTSSIAAQAAPAQPTPAIGILLPANGARVTSPVTVRFRLANYGVAPAGPIIERTGHFHLLINTVAGAPGTIIPADSQHIHYGKGQIEVSVPLPVGRHVLRAVLGDGTHKLISTDLVSAPVTVIVVPRS